MPLKQTTHLSVRFACDLEDIRQAQRLRYHVFSSELGADGESLDHGACLDCDPYDDVSQHLLLFDERRDKNDQVVGVYRLLPHSMLSSKLGFYSEGEYDLSNLKASQKRLLELGRSCLRPEYRGGIGLSLLWRALAQYIKDNRVDVLFGTASFSGVNIEKHAEQLALLHAKYLAPETLRPKAKVYQDMALCHVSLEDTNDVLRKMPPLIRSYLRLGGRVGDGAYVDYEFNTVDVCMIVETQNISARHWQAYSA